MQLSTPTNPAMAKHGMVASSQPVATDIGLAVLQRGGSAVDAAIATNAALGLMEPYMCGIGGDLFAIVWEQKSQQLYGLNGSGRAAKNLSYDALARRLKEQQTESIPADDGLAVSVPGTVSAWYSLHERFGHVSMAELLAPTIDYAINGFPVTPVIARDWHDYLTQRPTTTAGDLYPCYAPNGHAPAAGESFCNPDLARTYTLLAQHGEAVFYQGELAQRLLEFVRGQGGYLSDSDLADHDSEWLQAVSANYRGYDVFELPPNGQGMVVLQMLKMLEYEDLAAMGYMSVEAIHLMLEVKKLAFEDRASHYADMAFSPVPVAALLSDEYAQQRLRLINKQAAKVVKADASLLHQADTVYLSTADAQGNMVSLIQSLFHPFGSSLVAPGTGFALQNRGLSFSMDKAHPNVYAPGKRPFHTIIPAFVLKDDKAFLSFGVMGADMQAQGQVQVLSNMFDYKMNLQQAGAAPRWRHDGSTAATLARSSHLQDGGQVILEPGFPQQLVSGLIERGHDVQQNTGGFGGYQAILKQTDGHYYGASETRKDGYALGY